jgi:hypothetical protein
MAKIFRTEELSVNGDSIRISAENGNLIFKDANSNVVTSTDIRTQEVSSLAFKDLDLDSDVSSLKDEIADAVSDANVNIDNDISSLQAQRQSDEDTNDEEISSLHAQRTGDEAVKTQEVSSLAFKDLDLDSDISSLKAAVSDVDSNLDDDISSLQAQRQSDEDTNDEEISSLHAQRTGDEAVKTQEVSSLAFKDLDLDSDVSSLKDEIADAVSDANVNIDNDISSLQAQRQSDEDTNDEEISSLHAQRTGDEAVKTQEVSSLAFKDLDLDSDVSSLAALAAKNDVVKASVAIDSDMGSSSYDATNARVTVDFGRTFSTTPSVVGIMKAAANSPIIGVQLISISTTNAQFQLSDDVAVDGTYTIEVLASI